MIAHFERLLRDTYTSEPIQKRQTEIEPENSATTDASDKAFVQ